MYIMVYGINLTSSEGAVLKAGDLLTLTVSRDVNVEVLASFTVGGILNVIVSLVATRIRGTCMMSRSIIEVYIQN